MIATRDFKMSKSNFLRMLRKQEYRGKIYVEEYGDMPAELVEAKHEAIIDSNTFFKVQEVLDGKRWNGISPKKKNIKFPLRNFLICDCCGKPMTASSSKGRSKKYDYYHCHDNTRIKKEVAEELFNDMLSDLTISKEVSALYKMILKDELQKNQKRGVKEVQRLKDELEQKKIQLKKVDEMFLEMTLEKEDYKRMTTTIKNDIDRLESKLEVNAQDKLPVAEQLDGALDLLASLKDVFINGDYDTKRILLGSIFNEKLHISKEKCRTAENSMVVELLSRINGLNESIKKGTESEFSDLSPSVQENRQISNFIMQDVDMILHHSKLVGVAI